MAHLFLFHNGDYGSCEKVFTMFSSKWLSRRKTTSRSHWRRGDWWGQRQRVQPWVQTPSTCCFCFFADVLCPPVPEHFHFKTTEVPAAAEDARRGAALVGWCEGWWLSPSRSRPPHFTKKETIMNLPVLSGGFKKQCLGWTKIETSEKRSKWAVIITAISEGIIFIPRKHNLHTLHMNQ